MLVRRIEQFRLLIRKEYPCTISTTRRGGASSGRADKYALNIGRNDQKGEASGFRSPRRLLPSPASIAWRMRHSRVPQGYAFGRLSTTRFALPSERSTAP